jgi:hypothetical protein
LTFPGSDIEYQRRDLRVYDVMLLAKDCPHFKALALSLDGRRRCEDTRLTTSAMISIVPATNRLEEPDAAIAFLESLAEKEYLQRPLNGKDAWPHNFATLWTAWLAEQQSCTALPAPSPRVWRKWDSLPNAMINLSWTVFDLRRMRACPAEKSDSAIPLARIWTRCADRSQDIVWVDDSARHRQVLDCRSSRFNLRDWVGESLVRATATAHTSGVTINEDGAGWKTPPTLQALQDQVAQEIKRAGTIHPGAVVTAHCYQAPQFDIAPGGVAVQREARIFAFS